MFLVCVAKLDLAFVIDGSSSFRGSGRGNFRRVKNFVKRIVRSFKISPVHTRVAVVLFGSYPRVIFKFRGSRRLRSTLRSIDRLRYLGGATNLGKALGRTPYLFNRRSNRRAKVVVVLSGGKSRDNSLKPARVLKRSGCLVFAVGVGRHFGAGELLRVASSRAYVLAARFRTLATSASILTKKVCNG